MTIKELFTQTRDIPYRIPLSSKEEDTCCSGKCIRMFKALKEDKFDLRYRVCSFSWGSLHLPTEILAVPHEDMSTHVYLEVKINNIWINVDPTWDIGLRNILPVNDWDGTSNTQIAVPQIELFDLEKSARIMAETDSQIIEDDLAKNGQFYRALNGYFEKIRA